MRFIPKRQTSTARWVSSTLKADPDAVESATGSGVNPQEPRGIFTAGVDRTALWTGRAVVIAIGLVLAWWLVRSLWSVVFPTILALLLASILWPVNRLARRVMPKALAAFVTVLAALASIVGVLMLVIPSLASGTAGLAGKARENLGQITQFLAGPPFNLENADLNSLVDSAINQIREHAGDIASGITTGLGAITSGTVIFVLVLVFTFFCLKDGDRFLAWTSRWTDAKVYVHAAAVTSRAWQTLSGYIAAQAAVALVDAVFIGAALFILGIPLALPLTVLIFIAAFIPVVGAVATGLLAALIALISHGWVTALIVLGVVIVVQQLESNLLQPFLVGTKLKIHPAVVLASVTVGGTLFGIVGAFLSVPTTAVGIVVLRYLRDVVFPVQSEGDAEVDGSDSSVPEAEASVAGVQTEQG